MPAASLTITRRIFHIVHLRGSVASTYYEKRRAILFDLAIVLGLPLLNIVLSYIVQGHRFNIFEEVGCQPAIVNTALAYVLLLAWPLVIGSISMDLLSVRTSSGARP
ncbi:putative pheromone receptor [Phellopilus nigrolimitatus]|nr:putative pheromone receptor [Phellopilus nigrolimitatus]